MTPLSPSSPPKKAATKPEPLSRLWPRSLLWRTFFLIALLMLLSVAAWFSIFRSYEREPRARQLAQTLVSVANLTRLALITARPEARREMLRELSEREGIRIYPAEADDRIAPLPDSAFLQRVAELARQELGPATRFTLEREGEEALFISFRIDDSSEGEYWLALPRERIERILPLSWIGWGAAVLALSLAGAWLIMYRITRPLKQLELAARKVGAGETPPQLPEDEPTEIATVSRAFNQMSADLAQLEQDRALILAGISHDVRTPLTRLRMGIEMAVDETLREGMIADVEEMDQTIGQFLDFARSEGGEAPSATDLAALLEELVAAYQRRGCGVTLAAPPAPAFRNVRPKALRRAVANLIDNALRYADSAIEVSLSLAGKTLVIEVADRGPGIPPEAVERLKRPFTRLDPARSNVAGAGLGLAIVERIARTHGGRLDLLSRPQGGLIARLTLTTA